MTAHNNSHHRDDTAPGAPNLTAHQTPTTHPTETNSHSQPPTQRLTSTLDPATPEHAAMLAEHVRAIVDSFPPLTSEQQDRIATLLRTVS